MGGRSSRLPRMFYRRPADQVARDLLGCRIVRRVDGESLVGRIVETEAYLGVGDRASHAWTGRPTRRTQTLFRDGGCAYVYLVYGLHCMFNVVTGTRSDGSAVLIRAIEPLRGAVLMRANRGLAMSASERELSNGPGKLCQALRIDLDHDGSWLDRGPLAVRSDAPVPHSSIEIGPRVGIDYAGAAARWPLRFAVAGSEFVSRPAVN